MNISEGIKVQGTFEQEIYRVDGEKKTLIETYTDNNLVVSLGKEKLCKLLANDGSDNYIQSISFGTNGTNPTTSDTSITDEFTKGFLGFTYPESGVVYFTFELTVAEANGKSIREYGLLTNDGTLFARKVRGVINKTSDIYISGGWSIRFF